MSRIPLVIFGATGFTGKQAALAMAAVAKKHAPLAWAVAGRSQTKLEDLMQEISKATGEDQSHVKIITADVFDEESLKEMCKQANVIANCCGPYRLYGEPVVKAAIECRTHYVDVTGEPQFIESMQLKYDDLAREAGVFVVNACGFDSIPNDMGVVFLQQNFGGTLNSVESYFSASVAPQYEEEARQHGAGHYGTWESLVLSLANWGELKPLRQKIFPDRLPAFEPRLFPQRVIHNKNNQWFLPLPGADGSIVYRTQRHLYTTYKQRPVQFKTYCSLGSLLSTIGLIFVAVILGVMARFSFTRKLLLKYPRLFSGGFITHEGPTDAVMKHTSFKFLLYGKGWSDGTDVDKPMNRAVVAKVSGTNPGYGATVVALLYSAITILKERDNIPDKGGVLTTGVAFKDTNLIKNLHENGLKFEIIETTSIP